jgi:nucleobase:cation symporter-1, NCS1 family
MYARFTSKLSVRLEPDSHQYWLVHRTRVDVPSMYRPRGRYRYAYGIVSPCDVDTFYISENVSQNWRAAAAMVVSVSPTFPGLLDCVKGNANTGAGAHLFDITFILGVSIHLLNDLTHALT